MNGADLFGYVASISLARAFASIVGTCLVWHLTGPVRDQRRRFQRETTASGSGNGALQHRKLVAARRANESGVLKPEQDRRRSSARLSLWTARTCIGLGVLFCGTAHAKDLNDSSLAFLKLHRVPCLTVLKVGTVVLDEVVTCEDGREWMLFWLENEVAFVNPETRELYKWQWELNELYPQLYNTSPSVSGSHKRKFVNSATHYSATADSP